MAEPDYSKSWYERSGKKLPFPEELANHLRKELGQNAVHRYSANNEASSQLYQETADRLGEHNAMKWPAVERDKYYQQLKELESMFVRPHEKEKFNALDDLEQTDPMWEPETTERTLRQQYPDLVSRMERGQVQPVTEPQQRLPTPQPQKAVVAPPMRTAPPTPKPAMVPVQKPAQVMPPRQRQMTENEKALQRTGQYLQEQFKDIKPPTQQDLAKERLRNMMYEREQELRARDQVPVSLPEAVNPTGR